jgi:hypothetical protein
MALHLVNVIEAMHVVNSIVKTGKVIPLLN